MTRFKNKLSELFGTDLRSLAILRIGIALIIIIDLLFRFSDITAFYSDEGVLPRKVYLDYFDNWYVSLNLINGLPQIQALLFLITEIFAFLFLVGFHTRFINIILWFLMTSINMRNQFILTGGDMLLTALLFWGMFLPLGARFSIDSLIINTKKLPKTICSLSTFAILFQIALVYIFSAINKIGPEWYKDGTAVYYALSMEQYTTPIGNFIHQFPRFMKLLTFAIVWFQALGPLLLFTPFFTGIIRTVTVFGFFIMQLGFGSCLTVGIFPFITTVAICTFLPEWFWDKLAPKFYQVILARSSSQVSSISKHFEQSVLNNSFIKNINLRFPPKEISIKTSKISGLIIVFFLVHIITWNIQSVEHFKYKMPDWWTRVGYMFCLHQKWLMFGSNTLKEDFWYVNPTKLKNGLFVDLFTGGKAITWDKPKDLSGMYKNHRWKTYIRNLWSGSNIFYAPFGQYACNSWNKTHLEDSKIEEIEFYYAKEYTLPSYKYSKPTYGLMYKHKCY